MGFKKQVTRGHRSGLGILGQIVALIAIASCTEFVATHAGPPRDFEFTVSPVSFGPKGTHNPTDPNDARLYNPTRRRALLNTAHAEDFWGSSDISMDNLSFYGNSWFVNGPYPFPNAGLGRDYVALNGMLTVTGNGVSTSTSISCYDDLIMMCGAHQSFSADCKHVALDLSESTSHEIVHQADSLQVLINGRTVWATRVGYDLTLTTEATAQCHPTEDSDGGGFDLVCYAEGGGSLNVFVEDDGSYYFTASDGGSMTCEVQYKT